MKNIVVAIDSYKGSATSQELNQSVKEGILSVFPHCHVHTFEIADGGEGTLSCLFHHLGGKRVQVETVDLLQRPIKASYLLSEDKAFIEAAEVIGLHKITPSEKTIRSSTTIGLAKLFLDAKSRGVKEILLSLGGSGTSDGGFGFLEGLGGKIHSLFELDDIDLSCLEKFSDIKITALADVTNPYAGKEGFANFFGPQKGGSKEILAIQERQSLKFVHQVKERYAIDLQKIPGTGAAGGLGGAIVLLGGIIKPGFEEIARLLKIEEALSQADLVITGEGRMDNQTANGKVPYGMARLAKKYHLPTIAFCGSLAEDLGEMTELFQASFSIQRAPISLKEAMKKERTLQNIQSATKNVLQVLRIKNVESL